MTAPSRQRATRQRTAVTEALLRANGFRSAQQLHEDLRNHGAPVGLTTVYRHLQALAGAGEVDVVRADDGEQRFRACSSEGHHHHLVCRRCGRSQEIAGPAVEKWARTVAIEHGYTDVTHTVEIFGTCARCVAKPAAG